MAFDCVAPLLNTMIAPNIQIWSNKITNDFHCIVPTSISSNGLPTFYFLQMVVVCKSFPELKIISINL